MLIGLSLREIKDLCVCRNLFPSYSLVPRALIWEARGPKAGGVGIFVSSSPSVFIIMKNYIALYKLVCRSRDICGVNTFCRNATRRGSSSFYEKLLFQAFGEEIYSV